MFGTVIITGANGSLGLGFAKCHLDSYTEDTFVATLHEVLSRHPERQAHVESLDLSSLADVRALTTRVATHIAAGQPPHICHRLQRLHLVPRWTEIYGCRSLRSHVTSVPPIPRAARSPAAWKYENGVVVDDEGNGSA
ncbi:hypothetical protein VTI28DRAFT_4872 [Corynascus sepedonium]